MFHDECSSTTSAARSQFRHETPLQLEHIHVHFN